MERVDLVEIKADFDSRKPRFDRLEEEARFILEQSIKNTGLKVHSISSRVKSFQSLMDKAIRKEYRNPIDDINDVVGLRVVLLFLSDIPAVIQIVRDHFEVLGEDNKIEPFETTSFEYMSQHFIARLKHSYAGLRYDEIKNISFEIQVRTILMDAWANVSHYLDYKGEASIPSDLRRDFYALSGLFYVADRHFQLFYDESRSSQRNAIETILEPASPNLDQEINFDTLAAYLQQKFPDRNHSKPDAISELAEELTRNGYSTLAEVDRQIDRARKALAQYEKDRHRQSGARIRFSDVGAVRVSMSVTNEAYRIILDLESGDIGGRQFSYPERRYRHLLSD